MREIRLSSRHQQRPRSSSIWPTGRTSGCSRLISSSTPTFGTGLAFTATNVATQIHSRLLSFGRNSAIADSVPSFFLLKVDGLGSPSSVLLLQRWDYRRLAYLITTAAWRGSGQRHVSMHVSMHSTSPKNSSCCVFTPSAASHQPPTINRKQLPQRHLQIPRTSEPRIGIASAIHPLATRLLANNRPSDRSTNARGAAP